MQYDSLLGSRGLSSGNLKNAVLIVTVLEPQCTVVHNECSQSEYQLLGIVD